MLRDSVAVALMNMFVSIAIRDTELRYSFLMRTLSSLSIRIALTSRNMLQTVLSLISKRLEELILLQRSD